MMFLVVEIEQVPSVVSELACVLGSIVDLVLCAAWHKEKQFPSFAGAAASKYLASCLSYSDNSHFQSHHPFMSINIDEYFLNSCIFPSRSRST